MITKIPSSYDLVIDEKLQDINAKGFLLRHKKTGARIVLVSAEDTNKVFSIGFRTPPKNSTGVAHIIEHSVLCGSKSFPSKDPFVELAKGSLNTFLNAMTYPDRTIYPIASQNDKDFKNLMHVYMDAVLHPNIYDRKEIFDQEGWHYELEDVEGELKINGVVYNEMKGAFSSPEQQLYRMNLNSLFPDTAYGVESGGDPDFIPDLTYDEFLDFHRSYYHPSNCFIYLYGDMDFEERLLWLDLEYLGHYEQLEVDSEIRIQKGFDRIKEIDALYSIGEGEESSASTYLSYNTVIGDTYDKELSLSFAVLDYVLLDTPGAPIKQALLDAGIGKDILSSYSSEYIQPIFSITAKNSEEDRKDQFLHIIRAELEKVVKEGVDEKSLRAAINYYEFRYREADFGSYPKGLIYGLRVMGSWIYDEGNPFEPLKDNQAYKLLKERIGTGYYEKLIQKYLLNNTHGSLVILKPKAGLGSEQEAEVKRKLKAYQSLLSTEERKAIVDATRNLKKYQEEPSSKEDMEKIPMLSREDIGRETLPLYNKECEVDGVKTIHHDVMTNEIAYFRLLFDVTEISTELIPYMTLLTLVVGYVNTDNYSYLELSNEVNLNTGGISTDIKSFSLKNKLGKYLPVFEIASKVMYDKLPEAFRLIEEILYRTNFDDDKRLKEIIEEAKSRMQMRFNSSGHSVAVDRAMSYSSAHGLFKENSTGIAFYRFLEELVDHYDSRKAVVREKLKSLMQLIFTKDKLLVSITADDKGFVEFTKFLSPFVKGIKDHIPNELVTAAGSNQLQPVQLNEGFKTAMKVQYVARTGNFLKAGFTYTGALKVLRVIFSYDYLWSNVRVKGGAYGCMCGFSGVDGDGYFTSYRDPNLRETNQVYENAPEFVRTFTADERDITRNIIGTISSLDTPLTPQGQGRRSLAMYLSGVTIEDLQRERDEIINTTQEDIRKLSEIVEAILKEGNLCVIGNESRIEENRDLFQSVKNLMK